MLLRCKESDALQLGKFYGQAPSQRLDEQRDFEVLMAAASDQSPRRGATADTDVPMPAVVP